MNPVNEKKSPLKLLILQKFNSYVLHNVLWIWFKFRKNLGRLSGRWRSGWKIGWDAAGQRLKPCTRGFLIRIAVNAVKKMISPPKIANLTKIRSFHRTHRLKLRTLCGEKLLFSPLFTAILTLFFCRNLDPGLHLLVILLGKSILKRLKY